LVSSPDDSQAIALVQRISTHIPGNAEEKRGFQYFIKKTAPELSGYFDSSFWESLILQASSSEPSLRHAVTAIGSLHEDFNKHLLKYSTENTGFAINQYTKAIGHLRKSLATGKHGTLTALMSCILFICFDSIRGHFTAAMVHLQSGLRILRDARARKSIDEHIIEETIAPLFMRLSVQAIIYLDTRNTSERRAFVEELMKTSFRSSDVTDTFETIEDARNGINDAMEGLFRMFYFCDGDLPFCFQPSEAFELYDKYSTKLKEWNTSFDKFMTAKSHTFNSRQIRGAALLKIQHTAAKIIAETSKPDISETIPIDAVYGRRNYEPFKNDFKSIVNLSRSLITASEVDAKNGNPSLTFSTDLGVLGPLYIVCVHSEELRFQAMDLLRRCPRREGMWDGEIMSRMIAEYWEIEERLNLQQRENGGTPVPLDEVIDLEFSDGMKWEWRLKEPASTRRSLSPPVVRAVALIERSLFEKSTERNRFL